VLPGHPTRQLQMYNSAAWDCQAPQKNQPQSGYQAPLGNHYRVAADFIFTKKSFFS